MSTQIVSNKKRTIVRFTTTAATLLLLTACGAVPQRVATGDACPPVRTLICKSFGPQTRCTCSDAARLDRQLERFAQTAQLGPRGW